MPARARRQRLSLHQQRKVAQRGAVLQLGVVKHRGHGSHGAARADLNRAYLHYAVLEQVGLYIGVLVERGVVAQLYQVELREPGAVDITAPACLEAERPEGVSDEGRAPEQVQEEQPERFS